MHLPYAVSGQDAQRVPPKASSAIGDDVAGGDVHGVPKSKSKSLAGPPKAKGKAKAKAKSVATAKCVATAKAVAILPADEELAAAGDDVAGGDVHGVPKVGTLAVAVAAGHVAEDCYVECNS